MASANGKPKDDGDDIRRLFPQLSVSEFAALKCTDQLVKECELDPQFKRELAMALDQRGAITIRVECRNRVVYRALKLMELGAPECNASPNRAVQNIITHLLRAGPEQSNGERP